MNLRLRSSDIRFILFIIAILLFTFSKSFAQANKTASVTGNWSSLSTWGGNSAPVAGDIVTINSGITVTVDVNASCATLTFAAPSANSRLNISGTNSLTISGACTMSRPSSNINSQLNINAGSCSMGSLALGGSSSTRVTSVNITTGSLSIGGNVTFANTGGTNGATAGSVININNTGTLSLAGSLANITLNATSGTVNYNAAGAQTLLPITYNNLTLSNSGAKTFPTGTTTVNGDLKLEGSATATITGTLTFGSASGLIYNKSSHTTSSEWPATFSGSGGVNIQSGTVTLAGAKILGLDAPLSISSGATLNTSASNFSLTLGGNFINAGTLNANSSNIIITNTSTSQSIDGFTTTGTVSMTKTAGAVTFTGNINGGAFTLNGNGGTLNLGTDLTHTFTGTFTRTNGTLNAGSSILNIGGTTTGSGGTFSSGTSTVNYNAASSQTIFPFDYYNLSISTSGTKTISAATTVSNELNVNAGTLVTGGFLTLTSTASSTAKVGTLTGSITGDVTVQRFIPGGSNKRKWRFLSSPVNVSGTIAISQLIDNILITAPAGAPAGFDVNSLNPNNTASLRTYNESVNGISNNGWTDPTNITNTISSGIGMEVFVRGTRNLNNPYDPNTTPDDVTIDYTGALNTGNISPAITYTPSAGGATTSDGFNLVGNPYASAIDFTNAGLTLTNVDDKFWCYNPNTGSYGIYDNSLADSTNGIKRYIASGQAFFIRANAALPSITFSEAMKVRANGNNYFRNSQSNNSYPIMHINLKNDSTYSDEALIVLDETASCNSGDIHDAGKLFNDALNVYTLSDDKVNLTINSLPCIKDVDTISIAVFSYNGSKIMTTAHQFSFSGIEKFSNSKKIYLLDVFTNTLINLASINTYSFNITNDDASWGNNRFKLLFSNKTLGINNADIGSRITVFPNPATNTLYIGNTNNANVEVEVIDIFGRTMISKNSLVNRSIDISSIPSGNYFIKINDGENLITRRFIKE